MCVDGGDDNQNMPILSDIWEKYGRIKKNLSTAIKKKCCLLFWVSGQATWHLICQHDGHKLSPFWSKIMIYQIISGLSELQSCFKRI